MIIFSSHMTLPAGPRRITDGRNAFTRCEHVICPSPPGQRKLAGSRDQPLLDFAAIVSHVDMKSDVGIDEFQISDLTLDRFGFAEVKDCPKGMMSMDEGWQHRRYNKREY